MVDFIENHDRTSDSEILFAVAIIHKEASNRLA